MHIIIDQRIDTSLERNAIYTVLAERPESTKSARQRWWCAGWCVVDCLSPSIKGRWIPDQYAYKQQLRTL